MYLKMAQHTRVSSCRRCLTFETYTEQHIVTGGHHDTVIGGGHLDGALGVLADECLARIRNLLVREKLNSNIH